MEPSCHRHAMPHPVTWICSMNWPIDILVPAPIDPPGTRLAPQVSLAPAKLRALKVSPRAWSQRHLARPFCAAESGLGSRRAGLAGARTRLSRQLRCQDRRETTVPGRARARTSPVPPAFKSLDLKKCQTRMFKNVRWEISLPWVAKRPEGRRRRWRQSSYKEISLISK